MLIGYARVSTTEQDTDMQLQALRRAGVRKIFAEKTSSVGTRPELRRLLAVIRPGQTLTVYKLDRVARSLKDLLAILDHLERVGAGFRSLTEPIDTGSPVGRLMLQVLGAVAEFERSLIRERSIAGQVAALRRGVRWGGRRSTLTDREKFEVVELVKFGFTQEAVAQAYGVSRSTVSRAVKPSPVRHRERLPVLGKLLIECVE